MLDRGQLRPDSRLPSALSVRHVEAKDYHVGRALYEEVGAAWLWIDRLSWSDAVWRDYYASPGIELHVACEGTEIAGYFELAADGRGNVEIAYIGLRQGFIGRGLGALLLIAAVERAWDAGARRVWVHTSSRDHRYALANYVARGFRIYKQETRLTPTRPL